MRYAVFGDVHGNLEALEAVLEKIEKEQPDRYICVGDLVGYGADPVICIQKVCNLKNCMVVAGNHDFAAAGILNTDFFNTYASEAIRWTRQQLSAEDLSYLQHLKLVANINNITTTHSNLYLPEMFEYIQSSYDVRLGMDKLQTAVCFVGHSHIPVSFSFHRGVLDFSTEPFTRIERNGKYLVNVGSVGQPRDDNPLAAYAVYDEAEGVIWLKRTEYDIDKAVQKIRQAGLPEILAERLKYGR